MPALILNLVLLFAPATPPAQAETLADAGEAHLRRATAGNTHPLEAFENAHKNFDSAYLLAEDPRYLCRALAVSELALRTANFANEQERVSWEELQRDDLDRLREHATQKQRANCRFDATGKPSRRVALLTDADAPEPTTPPRPAPHPTNDPSRSPSRAPTHRHRAHMVSGALLTTAGLGFLGGFAGVATLELARADEMRGLIRTARTEQRKFTEAEDQRFDALANDLIRGRNTAIGLGVAGFVTLTTGAVLLATRNRTSSRGYALLPYGDGRSAGAVLRLRF